MYVVFRKGLKVNECLQIDCFHHQHCCCCYCHCCRSWWWCYCDCYCSRCCFPWCFLLLLFLLVPLLLLVNIHTSKQSVFCNLRYKLMSHKGMYQQMEIGGFTGNIVLHFICKYISQCVHSKCISNIYVYHDSTVTFIRSLSLDDINTFVQLI